MSKKNYCLIILFLLLTYFVKNIDAYNDTITHPDITVKATENSQLDQYLKNNLGFEKGIATQLTSNNKTVKDLLKKGSIAEDDDNADSFSLLPQCRAVNHFHNPLLPWDQSYMTDQPLFVDVWCWNWKPIYSNITWATSYLSPPPDGTKVPFSYSSSTSPYNWDRARDYYYKALTLTTEEDREIYFAWTFQTMGHVIHLLEDVAVPAHTRNDFQSHLIKNNNSFFDRIQPFENYVKNNPTLVATATPVFPSFTNTRLTDFWDTNLYNGSNPSALNNIGLAEFTNANYFSDFTIPNGNPTPEHMFPYPSVNSINYHICYDLAPDTLYEWDRKYISRKDKDGGVCPEPSTERNADHFAAVSLLNDESIITNANIFSLSVWLDDNVHNTYAKELLPRAVGYSAGLLDYFFRGTLEITMPDSYIYSITDGSVVPQQFTRITAKVRNSTPDFLPGEEIQNCNIQQQNCIIQAVARYKKRTDYQPDLSTDPPTAASREPDFSYSVSAPIAIDSLRSATPTEFTFDFTTNPIPAGITDLYLHVVFKGTLGNETDIAIAVGMKDINEPHHFSIWNATDWFYLDGVLRTANEIKNDPLLLARVDFNGNGIANEAGEPYIDPYDVTTMVAFYPTGVTPTIYNATFTPLPYGRYGRIIILTDMPNFYIRIHRESTNPPENSDADYLFSGVTNQENNGIFDNTQVITFRGIIQHTWSAYARYYPYSTGILTAPWPLPANTTPYPANTIYP